MREDHHAILVFYIGSSPCGNSHRRSPGSKFKFIFSEPVKGGFVFEEYHFAISLSAKLKTNSNLFHIRHPEHGVILKHRAIARRSADTYCSFTHIGEYHIA